MTRDEALEGLSSSASHRRLKSAQFFATHATSEDLLAVRQARQVESDTYVCKRLDQAIARIIANERGDFVSVQDEESEPMPENEILARSIEWVGGMLLHEMEGPIGRASFYATKEIDAYGESKTKKELDALKNVFTGIQQLVTASMPPKPQEFDLATLIDEIVATEAEHSWSPSVYGPRPFVVVSDPAFVRLAIVNGLRNAIEAIEQVGSRNQELPIVITWGETDRDFWLSIIDQGPGVSGSVAAKFEIGRSTKHGHRGFGLAIARRAMESLQGSVSLQPGTGGGTRYELRWGQKK